METRDRRAHWMRIYETTPPDALSWWQAHPVESMGLIRCAKLPLNAAIIDVGGGASLLADALVAAGHRDLTILDIAPPALARVRARLGSRPGVSYLVADVLDFEPTRRYALWHDRAVFHFLTDPVDRAGYHRVVQRALVPHGHLIVATFAEDGPPRCSGLDVQRYSADALAAEFSPAFRVLGTAREVHRTPAGAEQHFQYAWLQAIA